MKSKIHIDYKLPQNFQPEWAYLFKPDYKYKEVDLKVKELKNVFVSHYGLVIKNGLLVNGCAPNIGFSTYDRVQYFNHWRKAAEQMLVYTYSKSSPSLKLDDNKKYLVIHSPWFSYYFWITECLPRLLMVKEQLEDLVLIYPEAWKNYSFVNQTLEVFPKLEKVIIPSGVHLFVKNLIMPEVKPWTPMFIPEQSIEVKEFLLKESNKHGIVSPFNENIYISRKSAATRKFEDEKIAEETLNKFGFSTVVMEDYSFFEQIAIMQKAKNVFAITGAGNINVLFMKENGHLFDIPHKDYITRPKYKFRFYKFHFYKLCNIFNIKYSVLFHERMNDPNIGFYFQQNLIFNPDYVSAYLNKSIPS